MLWRGVVKLIGIYRIPISHCCSTVSLSLSAFVKCHIISSFVVRGFLFNINIVFGWKFQRSSWAALRRRNRSRTEGHWVSGPTHHGASHSIIRLNYLLVTIILTCTIMYAKTIRYVGGMNYSCCDKMKWTIFNIAEENYVPSVSNLFYTGIPQLRASIHQGW